MKYFILLILSSFLLAQNAGRVSDQILAQDSCTSFGSAIAIGDDIIIGAHTSDVAFIYSLSDTTWYEQARLTPADTGRKDFGYAVAIDSLAIVGALGDSERGEASGAIYVFGGPDWAQTNKLMALDARPNAWLGRSAATKGEIVIGGAYGDSQRAVVAGASYLFAAPDEEPLAKLFPGVENNYQQYGWSAAITNTFAVVGVRGSNYGAMRSGGIHVFGIEDTLNLFPESSAPMMARLGFAVAANEKYVVASSIPGSPNVRDSGGSVYIFKVDSSFQEWAVIAPDEMYFQDQFGHSLALLGDILFIGAPGVRYDAGTVFIYDISETPVLLKKLEYYIEGDRFGHALAANDTWLVVGAPNHKQGIVLCYYLPSME